MIFIVNKSRKFEGKSRLKIKEFAFDEPHIKAIQVNDKELNLVKEWMGQEKS